MNDLALSIQQMFSPMTFGMMLLGTALGVTVGAVPGLTGAMLIALALPLTFSMQPTDALVLLVSMYVGSVSGGLISATLLRIPGTPASMMTTLDGYPMARAGRPGRALGLGIGASFCGGLVSWVFLVLLAEPAANLSTRLGPFEFFALVMMAMALIASVAGRSLTKGLLSGALGILAAMPGSSPATGEIRWTMGISALNDGFKLLPVLIGLFAISQIITDVTRIDAHRKHIDATASASMMTFADYRRHLVNVLRSSCIGTWIGILPGIGANIGSVVAYAAAKNASKDPDAFGNGSEEGIVASESANNATVGGALIPLISLGIPGSVIDAILLGALVIHGLQPGPLLFEQNPHAVYTIIGAMLLANVFMFALMLAAGRWIARLLHLPHALLVPALLVLCVVGSYALANRMFDVWVMLGFGAAGCLLERLKIPLAPFVIGFVLAPIAEEHLAAGLMRSGGTCLPLLTRPISLAFTLISIALLVWSVLPRRRGRAGEHLPQATDTDT